MQTRRWVNQSQPQTLVIATFMLYAGAVFTILGNTPHLGPAIGSGSNIDLIENLGRLFVAVGGAYAGYLIAQEKKLGYYLGIAVAALPIVAKTIFCFRYQISPLRLDLVEWIFDIAVFALLVHVQSRSYVRLWFK
ncbi:MAG TPA: hypothetical protein VMZ22_07680 [Acidimicrobiales bacterium]|nr:hypothetical protein [Acidimicrobiales bacterium]